MTKDRNPEALARKLEIERMNLAHMLVHPEDLGETVSMLTPRDFEPGFTRETYKAILEAYESGTPVAPETFIRVVRQRLEILLSDAPTGEVAAKLGDLIGGLA